MSLRKRKELEASQDLLSQEGLTNLGAPVHDTQIDEALNEISAETVNVRRSNRSFSVALFAIICLCLLLVMLMGINSFKALTNAHSNEKSSRMGTLALSTEIRLEDEFDCIALAKGPEGDALVLTEHLSDGNIETRLYLYEGFIVKEFAFEGAPFNPHGATKLSESKTFSFALENGLLSMTTDTGTTFIALRSTQANSSLKGGA